MCVRYLPTVVFDGPVTRAQSHWDPEYFWDGLSEYSLLSFNRQAGINRAALDREYLHSEVVLRQEIRPESLLPSERSEPNR